MRIASSNGRLKVLSEEGFVDVEEVSGGRFPSDPQAIYAVWSEFAEWARGLGIQSRNDWVELGQLDAPVPRPRQILAVGLNYVDHVIESGNEMPTTPTVFTKFQSCLTGPSGTIALSSDSVDWEVELVVVMGEGCRDIPASEAWNYVAGLTAGQDLSDRGVQLRPPAPQFSMGKSYAGFGPIGPVVVTPDEFKDPDNIALECSVNGEVVQSSATEHLVFSVPRIIEYLSSIVSLYSGDLIFTGTPAGVGLGQKPPKYLRSGDTLETRIEGIGTMRHGLVAFEER